MAALMTDHEVAWTGAVVFGEPVAQLAAFVGRLPPCLVISASHGISGFRRLFVGTVVERLTRALDRPMLVVKPLEAVPGRWVEGFRSVLIGCDAHGHWQQTAHLLPLLLAGQTPRLHLLHVMEDPLEAAPPAANGRPYDQVQRSQKADIHRALSEQARRLFPRFRSPHLSVEVAAGVPHELLLREAAQRETDLVAVGVRASGMVGRWLAGSTTESLLRRSPCVVLTFPEPDRPQPDGGARP
jgi:nucleotide-binding universal stress UspA family protein